MYKFPNLTGLSVVTLSFLAFFTIAYADTTQRALPLFASVREFFGSRDAGYGRGESQDFEVNKISVSAGDQFFAGDGSSITAAKWAPTSAGPFTDAFVFTNTANFAKVDGTGTGASTTVAGINAIENFRLTSTSGTISNIANGVIPITVASGKTLDLSTQALSGSPSAGYRFTGPGVFATTGNTYAGGFTINSGTLVSRGVNAMGGSITNTLTINGGTIASTATRDFTGKFGGGLLLAEIFSSERLSRMSQYPRVRRISPSATTWILVVQLAQLLLVGRVFTFWRERSPELQGSD